MRSVMLASVLLALSSASPVLARTTALVVSGLGGNAEYAEAFSEQREAIAEALRSLGGSSADIIEFDAAKQGRDVLLDTLRRQAGEPADTFVLVLLGHGNVSSESWRFNINGPDISTEDLVEALANGKSTRQVALISTSASGAVLDVLSKPGRHVVTATKSGGEQNAVRFSGFLADALSSGAADVDRNEILTLAEAFRFANQKTEQWYEERQLLASEHARLTGDAPTRIALAHRGALRAASKDPAVAELLATRLALERDFHSLKSRKATLVTVDYFARLEKLLLKIARLQQSIDAATGWKESDV